MNPIINERFIECVNETISESRTSKTDIAKNLKIGRTKLSEILNRRMNVSIDTLSAFCLLYGYDPIWMIFGEGTKEEKRPQNIDYKEIAESKDEIIQSQKKQIIQLEKILALQEDKIADLERRLVFAEVKDKEEMSLKIKTQRKKNKEKDEIILAQTNTINELNEENNALKSRHLPPDEPLQPTKRV